MSRQIRNAIAVVLRTSDLPDSFLIIKRPNEGGDLDGHWGLPATPMHKDELPEDAARRVCREKLNCDAVPIRMVGTMFQKRNEYDMFFIEVEMLLVGNRQPNVKNARTDSTVYVDQEWTGDPSRLLLAAQDGSCCSTIFLTDQHVLERGAWIESLEGSGKVG